MQGWRFDLKINVFFLVEIGISKGHEKTTENQNKIIRGKKRKHQNKRKENDSRQSNFF